MFSCNRICLAMVLSCKIVAPRPEPEERLKNDSIRGSVPRVENSVLGKVSDGVRSRASVKFSCFFD